MGSKTGRPPNYYAILEVSEKASTAQIREAYKRAALKNHPDRIPTDHPDRAARTRRFQLVNDAYYTLSDPSRRREYDAQRRLFPSASAADDGGADPFADEAASDTGTYAAGSDAASQAFSWAWNFFTGSSGGGGGGGGGSSASGQRGARGDGDERQRTEYEQFADVFEEMLREEGMAADAASTAAGGAARPATKFWSMLGGLSGGALGFIIGNVPGLLAGAVAGNRLGAVRDARGKSVYDVFLELPQADRARLLSQLATKVLSHAAAV